MELRSAESIPDLRLFWIMWVHVEEGYSDMENEDCEQGRYGT